MAFDLGRYLAPEPLTASADPVATVATVAALGALTAPAIDGQNRDGARCGGLPLAALQDAAGEDWPEIADRPEALDALATLLKTQAARDRGEKPARYTQAALCLTCGPVWLWEGAPARLLACPWCLCYWSPRPIPRPPVRCGDCTNFQRSESTPTAGLGLCRLANAKNKRAPGHWPEVLHTCGAWRPLAPPTAPPTEIRT